VKLDKKTPKFIWAFFLQSVQWFYIKAENESQPKPGLYYLNAGVLFGGLSLF